MKKTLHFISHTHWDREWYMSFEQHRFRFVELMDKLIETFENDPDFKYFHLDGQVILLEDYLEIKPYMLEKARKYINDGRLKIGPWYVLQDEFLTSGEANVRNLLYGIRIGRKYGPVSMVGYFPDAFGNISQTPQILKGFGIDSAVFGRGVNPVGTNNTIIECLSSRQYNSELIWKAPDGSEVIGILFANWYHNAMEIPEEKEKARELIAGAMDKAAVAAATPHLLMMNGCDHQPVQVNLPGILKSLQNEFDGELIHSNFDNYIGEIMKYRSGLQVVEGELAGQYTDGLFTLVNTASSRIYLKQFNHRAQNLLEKWVEPIGIMSWMYGDEYRMDFIRKAWQYLMQNHPHDSICGCSVDVVHEEMVVRFRKSMEISEELVKREIGYLISKIDTSSLKDKEIPVVVFNPLCWNVTEHVITCVDFDESENIDIDDIAVEDYKGGTVAANVADMGRTFVYELPDDSFRKTKYVRRIEVKFNAENVPGLGYKTYIIKKKNGGSKSELSYGVNYAENEFIRLEINKNGSIKVINKENGHIYDELNAFEDSGDVGDEYNFISLAEDRVVNTLEDIPQISVYDKGKASITFIIKHLLRLPAGADKSSGKRDSENKDCCINTYVTLAAKGRRIDVATEFENNVCDHRLRALFPSRLQSGYCYADGQFDILEREIRPWDGWRNPSNCQRQQAFVDIYDGENGLLIANRGLPEYEVLRDGRNTIALTLVRSVGELGDWGYFPTPGAQCQGKQRVEYSIIPYAGEAGRKNACRQAYQFNIIPFKAVQSDIHTGEAEMERSFIKVNGENIVMSALKKCEDRDSIILRVYNIGAGDEMLHINIDNEFSAAYETNLNEERLVELEAGYGVASVDIPSKKIVTIELNKRREEGRC